MVAFGLEKVLEYVSDSSEHSLTDPLPVVALAALVGGAVIYLLGHVIFKWLTVHTVSGSAGGRRCATAGDSADHCAAGVGSVGCRGVPGDDGVLVESVVFAESRRKIRAELSHH